MITENIEQLFTRDLKKLQQELESYEDDFLLWQTIDGINNSAGNLCLHLIGNLNTYIGATLGNTGYIRNRELEFSLKNIPTPTLLGDIDKLIMIIKETLHKIKDDELYENYPSEVLGYPMTKLYFLMHLQAHLNYHLGQINYHRRIINNYKK
jgi:uncharacterized damage-inducible protein DinB